LLAQAQLIPGQTAEKADSSLALVLAARGSGQPSAVGVGVAVRPNGVLLTSYRLIKDARAVQVRLKSGEIFDRVQLLGVDERRDVAAIKITGTLDVLPVAKAAQSAAGDPVVLISLSAAGEWSVSEGAVASYLLADEVPGAGKGYRLMRFTAHGGVRPGAGVLLDARANLLGLVAGPYGADNNLAVPVESALGLADSAPAKAFASGAGLNPPASAVAAKPPVVAASPPPPPKSSPAVQPPAAAPSKELARATEPGPAVSPQGPEDSGGRAGPALASKDRGSILRSLKTIYIDAEGAKTFGNEEMKQALTANQAFPLLNLQIVDDRSAADAVLAVKHSLGGEYPFEVRSRDNALLVAGSASGYTPAKGARDVALYFVQKLRPFREAPKPQKK
jgi:hypothetical protein